MGGGVLENTIAVEAYVAIFYNLKNKLDDSTYIFGITSSIYIILIFSDTTRGMIYDKFLT